MNYEALCGKKEKQTRDGTRPPNIPASKRKSAAAWSLDR
jgi:hypothetical protein